MKGIVSQNSSATASRSVGPDNGYRWIALGIVYLSLLAYAVVFQSVPPILSLMSADLHLSHAGGGLLMSLFALPGVFLSIPAGLLVDRYGARGLTILCLTALIVGSLLLAAGPTFPVLALGRIIAGAGGIALSVVASEYVAEWFGERELGTAIGIYTTAMPVGTVLSLILLGPMAQVLGWRGALLIATALPLVALGCFLALYRPAELGCGTKIEGQERWTPAAILKLGLPIWLVGAIWMLFNAAVIGFLTFGPDYLLGRGYDVAFAGFLASFLMLPSPLLAPLVGHLLDKHGYEELIAGLGGVVVAGSILAIASTGLPLPALLLCLGVGAALVPTPVFALPPKMLRAEHVGTGYGIVATCLNVGVVAGPYLSGLARDITDSYQVTFYLVSLFAVLTVLITGILYLQRKRTPLLRVELDSSDKAARR